MAEMKFKFTIQPYQTDAVESVVRVFEGQPNISALTGGSTKDQTEKKWLAQMGYDPKWIESSGYEEEYDIIYRNHEVLLSKEDLLKNIRSMQKENGITLSKELTEGFGVVSLDIEMETGTGKTYVYIKTMFELYKTYGWGKFIVVVPSLAIREGVKKSFEMLQDHFMQIYGFKARCFVYNSKNLHQIDAFSQNGGINVMIINMQAFNASLDENKNTEGRKGIDAARIIWSERDEFGSRRPIDVISANHPIIILDEPQKMDGNKTQKAIKKFKPLFSLNYSATHETSHNLVYALDALDAFKKKIVKKIEVKGIELKNISGMNGYLYLDEIKKSHTKPPQVRIEFNVLRVDGSKKREMHLLKTGDSIYDASKKLEEYKGVSIENIDPEKLTVTFSNGNTLMVGEACGNEDDVRRIQIRETIKSHFEKEESLFRQKIKCLSLFFIDKVAKYRDYNDDGEELLGEYGKIFEEEYNAYLKNNMEEFSAEYKSYICSVDVQKTHKGYFSIDKKGRAVDSKGTSENDDIAAYELILKRKEMLLSLDEPTRFIFSHSALREGWDNPNVFQICTLKHSDKTTARRQEVGRGLRLCVNNRGERQDVDTCGEELFKNINTLTVVANESYAKFVADLQSEIQESLYERPTKVSEEYFRNKTICLADGKKHTITDDEARGAYNYLVRNNYIDDSGAVTDDYKIAVKTKNFAKMKPELAPLAEGIHKLMQGIFDPSILKEMINKGKKRKNNPLNENWEKFKDLWERINKKYAYKVEFKSDKLIDAAKDAINSELKIASLSYEVVKGEQDGDDFKITGRKTEKLKTAHGSSVKYDLVGKIAKGTNLTRRTVAAILKGVEEDKRQLFCKNPEKFIAEVVRLINWQKAEVIVGCITYASSAEEPYSQDIFNISRSSDEYKNAFQAKHAIQDYILTDGIAENSVERRFAESLDTADEVIVYAKLPSGPRGFYIPTPVGNYSPDWAIVFKKGAVKHIFFIAETKGTTDTSEMRPIEKAKIMCARKLFNEICTTGVKYHDVTDYDQLINEVMEAL